MAGKYEAQFSADGDWRLHLPTDADKHDVLALGPVIDGLRAFAAPVVDDGPIGYCLVEKLDPPNLTA